MDDGVEAEAPGGNGEFDEVLLDAGKTMASSECSFSSRREGERRLEACGARVSFGRGRAARFPAIKSKRKGRGGARVPGK
jgi:hypothetical protein